MLRALFLLCLGLSLSTSWAKSVDNIYRDSKSLPFNLYPILMSHDSASGELDEQRDHVIADWSRTQSVGLIDQLNCGARAFDYRPSLGKEGTLFPHHGPVTIHFPMKTSMKEVIRWTASHPNELVVVYLSHFDGDGCSEAVGQLLEELQVPMVSDCAALSLPYAEVLKLSQMHTGHLLAVFDCMDERFDPSIVCYGQGYSCYANSTSSEVPLAAFNKYMLQTTSSAPTSAGLWMTQGHWQSSTESVIIGTLQRGTVLLEEELSKVNALMAKAIRSKEYAFMNVLEVDHVCDGGTDLLAVLQEVYLTN